DELRRHRAGQCARTGGTLAGSADRAEDDGQEEARARPRRRRRGGVIVHHFDYRDGRMFAENVDLTALAEKVGTPFYVYSAATLRRHIRVMREAFEGIDTLIAYAMKANS